MARRTLFPKVTTSPTDTLSKVLAQLGSEVGRQKRSEATLDYYKRRDAANAIEKADTKATTKENKFKDEYEDIMMGYIKSKDFRTAKIFLGEVDGQPGTYTYDMARNSMVRPENLALYKSSEDYLKLIKQEETFDLKGENLFKQFLSRDPEVDKTDIYGNMLDAVAEGSMTIDEFNKAMNIGKNQPWFKDLGLSTAEMPGGPSADGIQADLKTVGSLVNRYQSDNFYKPAEAFTWAQSTYTPQGYTKLLEEADITSSSSDDEKREAFLKNLWRTQRSSPAAEQLMDDMYVQTIYRGEGKPTLFQILGEGVKPGKSRGQQYFVNAYVGLAIEADPELRGINNRSELIQKLSNEETQARIVQKVEEYLGPYDTWKAYMSTTDNPNPRFRLKLIED